MNKICPFYSNESLQYQQYHFMYIYESINYYEFIIGEENLIERFLLNALIDSCLSHTTSCTICSICFQKHF